MNSERMFIGTIYKVTKYTSVEILKELRTENYRRRTVSKIVKETEPYKEDAILIQIKRNGRTQYIDLENYTIFLELTKRLNIDDQRFMETFPYYENQLFIKETELKPYIFQKSNLSLRKVKKSQKN